MQFDRFSVALLILRPDAPQLDEVEANALQDAHLAHLADLHAAGHLVAAGPLSDEHYRGLSILNVGVEESRALKEHDPLSKRDGSPSTSWNGGCQPAQSISRRQGFPARSPKRWPTSVKARGRLPWSG
jgi:uncharacterized protein YciI